VTAGVAEAMDRARRAVGADGLVVVAGSIMLVGEARSILLDLPRDPPVAL
jgi:folylpolyglutamate synthase/dihydropteroate synthase